MAAKNFINATQMEELRAALREVSDDIGDLVASLLEDMARDIASTAGARVPTRTGRARASYQARGMSLSIGEGAPYVPWLEFGGKVGRKGSVSRPYSPKGRYLYPTIAGEFADFEARIDDLISQATNGFLEVDGG